MQAEELLRSLRVTSRYKGYTLVIDAINLFIDDFGSYVKVTKDIYPILARKYNTSEYSVERNIRTVIEVAWRNNKKLIQDIIGYRANAYPTNGEFIECAAYYIIQTNKEVV